MELQKTQGKPFTAQVLALLAAAEASLLRVLVAPHIAAVSGRVVVLVLVLAGGSTSLDCTPSGYVLLSHPNTLSTWVPAQDTVETEENAGMFPSFKAESLAGHEVRSADATLSSPFKSLGGSALSNGAADAHAVGLAGQGQPQSLP